MLMRVHQQRTALLWVTQCGDQISLVGPRIEELSLKGFHSAGMC